MIAKNLIKKLTGKSKEATVTKYIPEERVLTAEGWKRRIKKMIKK